MGDGYIEVLVQRRPAARDRAAKILLISCTLLLLAAGVIFGPLILAGAAGFFLLDWLTIPELTAEYEYLLVKNCLDIDKIYFRSRRRPAGSYDLRDLERMVPAAGEKKTRGFKSCRGRNFTSKAPGAKTYQMVFRVRGKRRCLLIEPGEELLAAIKRKVPDRVFCD